MIETFAARRARAMPGAPLSALSPVAYAVATCRAPAPLYADEPIHAAIVHRRECWQMLLQTRRARRAVAEQPGGAAA